MQFDVITYSDGKYSPKNSTENNGIGEYFPKKTEDFSFNKSNEQNKIYKWFNPKNNYPETILSELRKGSTLQAIITKHSNYVIGGGVISDEKKVAENILVTRNKKNDSFYDTYEKVVKSFNKLGNAFVKIITNKEKTLITYEYIQPQKCRLTKSGVEINPDWINYNKDNSVKIALFPEFSKIKNGFESILHIKNDADGFDHYGIIEEMESGLLLNEKEYRRNIWQKNQIKNGFKKDFIVLSEKLLNEKDEKEIKAKSKQISGDGNVGGLYPLHVINENKSPLVPLNADYEFDFAKDDTASQLFRLFRFPNSLFGIRDTGNFSVEQIESDYEQYLVEIESTQKKILSFFDNVYEFIWDVKSNLRAINIPPSQIIVNYANNLDEEKKVKLISRVLTRYGIEL